MLCLVYLLLDRLVGMPSYLMLSFENEFYYLLPDAFICSLVGYLLLACMMGISSYLMLSSEVGFGYLLQACMKYTLLSSCYLMLSFDVLLATCCWLE